MGLGELIASFRADRKIRKLLRGARETTLARVPDDAFVRVIGTVQPHRSRVLEAPLSGRLCAYYSLVIRVVPYPRLRAGMSSWQTLRDEQEGVPFELVDAAGDRAVIDPTDAWISSSFDHKAKLDTPRAAQIWERLARSFVPPRDARIEEATIAIGEKICVFGAAVREPYRSPMEAPSPGELGYRDDLPMRLRFSGTAKFPLVIRDDLRSL